MKVRRSRAGVSVLEAALGVAIGGSVLAVFVPTFVRSLHTSKTSEATENLAELHAKTAAYFSTEFSDATARRRWCLPVEAGPTPSVPSANPVDFDFLAEETPGHETWAQLGFNPQRIRYRYSIVPEATGCGIRRPPHAPVVVFVAESDLDLDGNLSTFERAASVSSDGELMPEGAVYANQPVE